MIYGGWLLALWITIQIRQCVYLEYPYLAIGLAFTFLGAAAFVCLLYGTRRRGYWRMLLGVPVLAGVWTVLFVPDITPFDARVFDHIGHVANGLDSFSGAHGRFPGNEAELQQVLRPYLQERSQYREHGGDVPFRAVLMVNANGPFLGSSGDRPGVVFYSVSPDRQDVWLTATELDRRHPVGNHVQFVGFITLDSGLGVIHRHASQGKSRSEGTQLK